MTYSPREPWSKIPIEGTKLHVWLILRWVFIRKGVGASAQVSVQFGVSAYWLNPVFFYEKQIISYFATSACNSFGGASTSFFK